MTLSIDAYLDAVDLALLKSGAARPHRQGIIKDLEAHIREMLAERTAGTRDAAESDIAAVLATLGAPDAYASGASGSYPAPPPPPRPRRILPSAARWGILLTIAGWIGLFIVFSVAYDVLHHQRGNEESDLLLILIAAAPIILMLFLSTCLGIQAWRQRRREPQKYWGRIIALPEILAFPLLVLIASPLLFFTLCVTALLAFALHSLYNHHRGVPRLFAAS